MWVGNAGLPHSISTGAGVRMPVSQVCKKKNNACSDAVVLALAQGTEDNAQRQRRTKNQGTLKSHQLEGVDRLEFQILPPGTFRTVLVRPCHDIKHDMPVGGMGMGGR